MKEMNRMTRKNHCLHVAALLAGVGLACPAAAANTADAQLVLTITLDDVLMNGSSATFDTSSEAGNIGFSDIGPNGYTIADGFSTNPPGSVGSANADISYSLNGIDPFEDDYDMDSFGIGDSVVVTMNASASATTPGSIFYGQVNDQLTLYFESFASDTDQFTFSFSWEAHLTGNLDNTSAPGSVLALADGLDVGGEVQSPAFGNSYDFLVWDSDADGPYFSLGQFNPSMTADTLDEMANGTFEVEFNPGDYDMTINFYSDLVVNATVDVPEPSSLALLALGGLCLARRRR